MKIELEEPFKSLWKHGYLRIGNKDRQILDLVNDANDRTTTSYARYLKSVQLGYIIPNELEVDHDDNDKTNDSINNLNVLTKQQNIEKENLRYLTEEQVSCGYHCAHCELPFIITEREKKMRLAQDVELAFCSRSCAASYHAANNPNVLKRESISVSDQQRIKELKQQGFSSYKISELTGFSRNTVMKYW